MDSFLKACEDAKFDVVMTILQDTESINVKELLSATDANGWNCLHWAAWHSNIEFMRYLLTMEDLDVTSKNRRRATIFDIALKPKRNTNTSYYPPGPIMEMLKMLFAVSNKFVNQCNNDMNVSPLQIAIKYHHFDVVKLLVELGSDLNHENKFNNSVLHVAAAERRVDCIRFLMKERRCDPIVGNYEGWPACCTYVKSLLEIEMTPSKEQLELISEMLLLTFKSPVDTYEIYLLLIDCFLYKTVRNFAQADIVFIEIVKVLLPYHPRKDFVEKILEANLKSNYCLITMTMFEMDELNFENCQLIESECDTYSDHLELLEWNFLHELFALYLADEKFVREYLVEVVKLEWVFNEFQLISKFCQALTKETSLQKVFDFVKILTEHKLNFFSSIEPAASLLPSDLAEHILKIFVPLSNFVHVPTELVRIFGVMDKNCFHNFDESDNCIQDYHKLIEKRSGHSEVVSLKNLSRLSLREHTFANYSHFEALTVLYSSDIPLELKQFLCYNFANLKF